MGSGLIYAVIIVMWGAYFIPLWLRRHEERSEARSVDRFSHAMQILSGRGAEVEPVPENADREVALDSAVKHQPGKKSGGRRPGLASGVAGRSGKAARSLALRRRRILAALLVANILTAILTPLTPLPWFLGVLPAVAMLGFVVHLRLQARRTRELSRNRSSVRRRTLGRLRRFDSADRIFQARRALREEGAQAQAEGRRTARAAVEADDGIGAGWQPVPVPLPTYVTKPVAPRPVRPSVDQPREEPFDQTASARASVGRGAPSSVEQLAERTAIPERRAVND